MNQFKSWDVKPQRSIGRKDGIINDWIGRKKRKQKAGILS